MQIVCSCGDLYVLANSLWIFPARGFRSVYNNELITRLKEHSFVLSANSRISQSLLGEGKVHKNLAKWKRAMRVSAN